MRFDEFRCIQIVCGGWALLASTAYADLPSPKLSFGGELQGYREVVSPNLFPVLNLGARYNSNESQEPNPAVVYETLYDIKLRLSPTHPKSFAISSQNFYWGEQDASLDSPLRFTFGRRKINWSSIDELWGLGQFEPLDSFDRLRPFSTGLTGVFAFSETRNFNFRMFFSGIYTPEMAPNVVIENNRFSAEHPQAISSAPQTFTLLNRPTPLGYRLELPSISRVLFRQSSAVMMETKRELPFYFKFAYGYLPLNYFPIALEASLDIPLDQIVVTLRPRLLHHHVYVFEQAYRFNDFWSFGMNTVIDHPADEVIPGNYTTTPLTTSYSYSPRLTYSLPGTTLTLSHLWVFGGLEADVGPYADPSTSIFSSRIFFRNASQISLITELNRASRLNPRVNFKAIHEYSVRGDWFSGDFILNINPKLVATLGGDILSSYKDRADARGAEFLSDLRSFGRVRIGAQYEF